MTLKDIAELSYMYTFPESEQEAPGFRFPLWFSFRLLKRTLVNFHSYKRDENLIKSGEI